MMVVRSMVVMRVGESGLQSPEEIIARPPVYRSRHQTEAGRDVLLEVADAQVAFGGEVEIALRTQARYIAWLNVAKDFVPQPAGDS